MRYVKISYADGQIIGTSLNPNLSDAEIYEYFKIGKVFNIGNVVDNCQKVVKCEIIK